MFYPNSSKWFRCQLFQLFLLRAIAFQTVQALHPDRSHNHVASRIRKLASISHEDELEFGIEFSCSPANQGYSDEAFSKACVERVCVAVHEGLDLDVEVTNCGVSKPYEPTKINPTNGGGESGSGGNRQLLNALKDDELQIKFNVRGNANIVEPLVINELQHIRDIVNSKWDYMDDENDGVYQRAETQFKRGTISCTQSYCVNHAFDLKLKPNVTACNQQVYKLDYSCRDYCCDLVPCSKFGKSASKGPRRLEISSLCDAADGWEAKPEPKDGTTLTCAYWNCEAAVGATGYKNDSGCCVKTKSLCSAGFRLHDDADKFPGSQVDPRIKCGINKTVSLSFCESVDCLQKDEDECCKMNDPFVRKSGVGMKIKLALKNGCSDLNTQFYAAASAALCAALDRPATDCNLSNAGNCLDTTTTTTTTLATVAPEPAP